jgi:ribonuclease-3
MDASFTRLQKRLGYAFADAALLTRALSHKSHGADHNERLEFLGDAVLSMAVSILLYSRFSDSSEGDLTRVRAHLVREDTLHKLALGIGVPDAIRLGEGEARSGGAQRPSILADALEALIGAVYLDGGYEAARALVEGLFAPLIAQTVAAAWTKDAKTELQERLQAHRLPVPTYRITETRGRQHDQVFVVACAVPDLQLEASGEGRSRRAAEQAAAQAVLATLSARLPAP